MPRKAKEEAEKTRARILASALDLFAKKGYEHTTFTDIAARLKLTKGAVYWYFDTKETLLLALVDEMLEKFTRQIGELMPKDELTFTAVSDMMVENARQIVGDPKGTAFFLLMHEQIRWSSDSMANVREQLLRDVRFGPWQAFTKAVANDKVAGRVKDEVVPERVAHTCLAIWDGLVHVHIAKFMKCGLFETLALAFQGVWQAIRKV
jgi:TetR/AcrR family acrAB operon transcriptional repressor